MRGQAKAGAAVKRYRVHRSPGAVHCEVHEVVEESGCGRVYQLPHLVYHSPDGFECGYGGSGPADLARSIVGDLLGDQAPSPHLYQAVKWELVATLGHEGGEITEERVLAVLEAAEAGASEGP